MATKLIADMKEKNPVQLRRNYKPYSDEALGSGAEPGWSGCFLAGGLANYITGAIIPVDGGYLGK